MTHYDIFNYKGVSESREVARGPKDPPPGSYRVKLHWVFKGVEVEAKMLTQMLG